MIIFENHFDDCATILIDEYIFTGDLKFKIDQLDEICDDYEIPDSVKQEILEVYTGEPSDPKVIKGHLHHDNYEVRRAIARCGYHLDTLIDDLHYEVKCEVARQGYGLDRLVNAFEWQVRRAVAEQGYDLDVLKKTRWYGFVFFKPLFH